MTRPSRAIGYARVSTEEQAISGLGLAVQREKITGYCANQDLELLDIVSDEGFSAATMNRPGLTRALARLQAGEADTLVIFKLDRLTRNLGDWSRLVAEFFGDKFHLVSFSDRIDTRSASGRMTLNVIISVVAWERETIGERTGAALRVLAAKGCSTGKIPYGYRRGAPTAGNGQRPTEIDPERAEVVRRIFRLRAEGNSYHEIIDALRKAKIPSPTGRGWVVQTLCTILAREDYIGRVTIGRRQVVIKDGRKRSIHRKEGGTTHSFAHLAIVDVATWERVQALHREYMKAHFPSGRQHRPSRWILAGRIACPECGGRLGLTGTKSRKRQSKDEKSGAKPALQYFRCQAHDRGACSFASSVNAARAHDAILGRLQEVLSDPARRAKLRAAYERYVDRERASAKTTMAGAISPERRLVEVEAKIARLADLLADGASPALATKLRDLEAEAATLRAAESTTSHEDARAEPTWRVVEAELSDVSSALLGDAARGRVVIDAILRGERLSLRPGKDGGFVVSGKVFPFSAAVGRNKREGTKLSLPPDVAIAFSASF